jgi:hypothetical protein
MRIGYGPPPPSTADPGTTMPSSGPLGHASAHAWADSCVGDLGLLIDSRSEADARPAVEDDALGSDAATASVT